MSFLGTRNEVVKIKHYNRKKTDKRETSWSFQYKRCPGVELGTILPGKNPASRPAGKSGSPADSTGSGWEITVSCESHGVRSGNQGPLACHSHGVKPGNQSPSPCQSHSFYCKYSIVPGWQK